jgi:phosphoglycolate phosphatase-like HAD superfamily hydrolase
MRIEPRFFFDLDGTLVDSVYQHVLAWKRALEAESIELSVWRMHRRIGMRETRRGLDAALMERLRERHAAVVGDSVWDMLSAARCRALGVGPLSGG